MSGNRLIGMVSIMVLAGCIASSVHAAAPDAGSLLQEEQRLQQVEPSIESSEQREEVAARKAFKKGHEVAVEIKEFQFSGDLKGIKKSALQKMVKPFKGKKLTFSELQGVADTVTKSLHQEGFVLAQAILPPQEISSGVVQIKIVMGKVGVHPAEPAVTIMPTTPLRIHESYLHKTMTKAIGTAEPLHLADLERGVLLINSFPGVTARANLVPGAVSGSTKILLDVKEDKMLKANLWGDNYGSRYAGKERASALVQLNDPFRVGDQLTAKGTTASGLDVVQVGYNVPLGFSGLQLGANVSHLHYHLGEEFESLDASGFADTASLNLSYPFVLARGKNLTVTLNYDKKILKDYAVGIESDSKVLDILSLSFSGYIDNLGFGRSRTNYSIAGTTGHLDLSKNSSYLNTDASTAQTDGEYKKITYSFSRLQKITQKTSLFANFSGQWSHHNLDSSEKFVLGGPSGVRAYPPGEGSGDVGELLNVEFRYEAPFLSRLGTGQLIAFYDVGAVTQHKSTWANWQSGNSDLKNHYTLQGAGLGFSLSQKNRYTIRAAYAKPMGSNQGLSSSGLNSDGVEDGYHVWLQAIVQLSDWRKS